MTPYNYCKVCGDNVEEDENLITLMNENSEFFSFHGSNDYGPSCFDVWCWDRVVPHHITEALLMLGALEEV